MLKLIGFKLTGTDAPDAIAEAVRAQMAECDCDLVVHNSLKDISPQADMHLYHLYDRTGAHEMDCRGARALAHRLAQFCIEP